MSQVSSVALSHTVKQSQSQISAELDGDVVLMSIDQGKYYNLNAMASQIWKFLDTPIAVEALCDGLVKEFDEPEDIIRADVIDLLNHFYQQNLIEVVA
jgi:hypothetical protein